MYYAHMASRTWPSIPGMAGYALILRLFHQFFPTVGNGSQLCFLRLSGC